MPPASSSSHPSSPTTDGSAINSSSPASSTAFVVGISVGGTAVLMLVLLVFTCWRWKKRRAKLDYYGGPPKPPLPQKENRYNGRQQNLQYSIPPQVDHALTIPSSLPPPPAYASRPSPSPHCFPSVSTLSESGASGSSAFEKPWPQRPHGSSFGFSSSTFSYEDLLMATDGFSDANFLGQGGFGYVHKGTLPNGKEVAVKQLKAGSRQGEREFHAEIETISRVHHKHLVLLVGYCTTDDKMLLVYEFVPNNTLEFHLHGKGRPVMSWPTRLKIALGSAKGLAYLHEDCHPKIIHRDIKAANILLDFDFETKVADFGLARFSPDDNTHVSTRVMGTFGYLAPEYASTGKLTDKSDVFSFGVVLLELISGKRPVDTSNVFMDDSLVDWARPLLTRALDDGNYAVLTDPNLEQNYNHTEMACMIACASACVRHSGRRRPRMSQIVRALDGDISPENLNEGMRPGHDSLFGSHGSSDLDACQYNEDMKNFRKLAMASQEEDTTTENIVTDHCQTPYGVSSLGSQTQKDGNSYRTIPL